MSNSKDMKIGAIFSYILIVADTLYGLLFTPFLISTLGEGEYGVYKIIASLISSITVLDLGIGSTALRYISKYHAEKDDQKLSNYSAMGLIQAGVLSTVMVAVCVGIFFSIDSIYGNSLSEFELEKAKQLFSIFIILLVANTFEKIVFSIIAGCEHFALANFLKLFRIVSKVIICWIILLQVSDSVILLWVDLGLTVFTILIQLIYIRYRMKLKIKLWHWDNDLFKQSFVYTMLMFIQSLAVQLNGNLDNMVIGAVIGSSMVTVYSIGLTLYGMYEKFAMAFSDLMLPTVSKQIAAGASNTELENTVIKVGRFELIALGGALCGYLIVGKEFIRLWLGDGYDFAWLVGLILMVPTTIPLIQNVSLSILRAKNKMGFRTVAVCIMAVFNLVFTIVGVRYVGAVMACVGTAIGLVGANIIAMNIYYYKVLKLNIFRIFKCIFSRIWLCCLIASAALIGADLLLTGSWLFWILKCGIFCIVYLAMLLLFGFNVNEKNIIFGKFARRRGDDINAD